MFGKPFFLYSSFLLLAFCPGCEAYQVLTASYHEPKVETPESITRYIKKNGMGDYPILRYDSTGHYLPVIPFTQFQVYDSTGNFLSLRDTMPGCPDKKQNYVAMKYILQHGSEHFILDTLTQTTRTTLDTNEIKKMQVKFVNRPDLDTSLWETHIEKISTHLDNVSSHFTTLHGEPVNLEDLYSDYLVLNEFMLGGVPKFERIIIKEKMRDIKKLNKEFGNRIQFVLINTDKMQ